MATCHWNMAAGGPWAQASESNEEVVCTFSYYKASYTGYYIRLLLVYLNGTLRVPIKVTVRLPGFL